MKESELQRLVRLRLGAEDGVAVWRNNVGVAQFVSPNGSIDHVHYGLCPGSCDLIGLVSFEIRPEHVGQIVGRFVGIELKAGSTHREQRIKQGLFRDLVNRLGGHAREVRSTVEIDAFLRGARVLP